MGFRGWQNLQPAEVDKFPVKFNPRSKLHNRIIQFIECLPLTPVKKVRLVPWQKDFIRSCYPADRRVREAYLSVARKNGKTSLCVYLILAYLLSDAPLSEYGGILLAVAIDKQNARIIYETLEGMLCLMPDQLGDINIQRFNMKIENIKTRTIFSVEAHSMNVVGKNPLLCVIDEAGQWVSTPSRGERVYEALTTGTARDRALTLTVGTQAPDDEHFYSRHLDRLQRIFDGRIKNDTVTGAVYSASPHDDLDDEATWHKANPSLGTILSKAFFKSQHQKMREMPSRKNSFKNYNLNMRISPNQDLQTELFPRESWLACKSEYDEGDLIREKDLIIGIDLAKVSDINAVVMFAPDSGRTLVYPFITRKEAMGVYRSTYSVWSDMGVITILSGDVTDFLLIADKIYDLCTRYHVRAIAYDPYSAHNLKTVIAEQGYKLPPMQVIRQTWLGLSPAIKDLMHRVMSTPPRLQWHSPVLSAHVMDAKLRIEKRNNCFMVDKGKRKEDKIDCLSALLNCIAYNLDNPIKHIKPSFMLIH